MPLFRSIPHHITCTIFAALWAAVLAARLGAVDPRVLSGHPVAAAHRVERARVRSPGRIVNLRVRHCAIPMLI